MLVGCSDDDDDAVATHATIIPAINPGFDSITEIASSATASGSYAALDEDNDYTYQGETITLRENLIPVGGVYLRISGMATIKGSEDNYVVYTFLGDNRTAIAANEFTSLAVLEVGKQNVSSFDEGLSAVATKTGISVEEISKATVAKERSEKLTQSMRALANNFKGGAAIPGTTTPSSIVVSKATDLDLIALGALAYDNWLKVSVCNSDGAVETCAKPETPGEIMVQKNDTDSSTFADFVRCSSCHGWDLLGEKGGYAFRSQAVGDDDYVSHPHAGGVNAVVSRDISAANYTAASILKSASTIRYANNSSPSTNVVSPGDWNAMVRASAANDHPNFSSNGDNSVVPDEQVINALVAFINSDEAKASNVFSSITVDAGTSSLDYEVVSTGSVTAGESFYADTCFRCHRAPDNQGPNPLNGFQTSFVGNLMTYMDTPSKLSKLRHVAQWGRAGSFVMTRDRMGYPNASNVADLFAYLNAVKDGSITDGVGFTGTGDASVGQTIYDNNCAGCHNAGQYDTTALCFSRETGAKLDEANCTENEADASDLSMRNFAMKRDLSDVSSIMGNVTKLTDQDILDLAAFFRSNLMSQAAESN